MKKNSGFTLVELIVVIAILGILAGVAIPVYSGYISKANEAADYTLLDSVKTAVVFVTTEANLPYNPTIKTITVNEGTNAAKSIAVTYNGTAPDGVTFLATVDVSGYISNADIDFKSDNTKAVYTAGTNSGWVLSKVSGS